MAEVNKDFNVLSKTVIGQGLCTRCGVCSGICPTRAIKFDKKAFPQLDGECSKCGFCVRSCPGSDVNFPELSQQVYGASYDPADLCGYVENIYVSHPQNQTIRMAGASGGLTTGLLVYLLKKKRIDGAVVVEMDSETGYRTKGILATTEKEIRDAAQSKYCVTPSMEVLKTIRKRKGKFAVVALPCQLHGLRKLEKVDSTLSKKIAYYFGLFCNCNLNVNGHLDVMRTCGIDLKEVKKFNFRGGGWPGGFHVQKKDGSQVSLHTINIKNVMNVMFRLYGSKRCYLCYDALAEYADLSFGDFWAFDYNDSWSKRERCTLVYQRTAKGKEVLDAALADGYIEMNKLPLERNSKRILKMAKGKKNRTIARLYSRKKKKLAIPNYHFQIPKPTRQAFRSVRLYNIFQLFRTTFRRRIILKILFSPVGEFLNRLNEFRKTAFSDYNGN